MDFLSVLFIFSILAGQLLKFPVVNKLGPTALDFFILLFCLMGLYKLKFKLRNPPLFIKTGILFIFVCILSLAFTPLELTASEYLLSALYIVRLSLLFILSWIIISPNFQEFRKKIPSLLLLSGIGLAVLGLLQFIFFPNLQPLQEFGWDPHYFRTVSTFLDPNFTGAYFTLTLILFMQNFSTKKMYILFFVIVYIALLTTFSRSSYLMFFISGLTLSFFKKSRKTALSTIILFIILLTGFQIYTQLIARPRNIDRQQSASYRLNTWQQGLTLFQLHPIVGVGFNSYRYAVRQYNLGDPQFLQSHGSSSNDSSILFVAATTGIVGLFIYSLFLISLIKHSLKNNLVLAAAVLGLLVHSTFSNSLFFPPILLWMMLNSVGKER